MSESSLLDISPSMAVYLDPHLLLKDLDFLGAHQVHDIKQINRIKLSLLKRTGLLSALKAHYEAVSDPSIEGEKAAFLASYEEKVAAQKNALENPSEEVQLARRVLSEYVLDAAAGNPRMKREVQAESGITADVVEAYILHAKALYESGDYTSSLEAINNILKLQPTSTASLLRALWGGLASSMMAGLWEESVKFVASVKETIENKQFPQMEYLLPMDQLRSRATLLHWALYVYSNSDISTGMEQFVSLCMDRFYLQCIENLCPWMLRYLAAGLILSPVKRKHSLRDALNVITSSSYLYSDPLTKFLENLFRDFDFDLAQAQLITYQEVILKDFFLEKFRDRFTHESRVLVCEMYCTIHCKINLAKLAEKMQLSEEEAERWMVDLVRGGEGVSSLDAKIDSANGLVIMAPPSKSNYQLILERTRDVSARTEVLAANVDKLMEEQAKFINYRKAMEPIKR